MFVGVTAKKITGDAGATAHEASSLLYTLGLWQGSRLMVVKEKVATVKDVDKAALPSVKHKHLRIGDVLKVVKGKATRPFAKNSAANDVPENLCLSVLTKDRSLDLQFKSSGERDKFAQFIERVVRELK